jgi:hypothetical protein
VTLLYIDPKTSLNHIADGPVSTTKFPVRYDGKQMQTADVPKLYVQNAGDTWGTFSTAKDLPTKTLDIV